MHQIPKHLPRRDRDLRTWTKHRLDARLREEVIVLLGDHPANHHLNISPALFDERLYQHRHERVEASGLGGNPDDIHTVLNGLSGNLARRREHGRQLNLKAEVGKGRGDHLGTPVVAILPILHTSMLSERPARTAKSPISEIGDSKKERRREGTLAPNPLSSPGVGFKRLQSDTSVGPP